METQNPSLDITTFSVLLVILVMLSLFVRSRRRQPVPRERPLLDLAYEWFAEPLNKASSELCKKFTVLDKLPDEDDIQLIRLGIYNLGTAVLRPEDFKEPIVVEFENQVELLAVEVGETRRTPLVEADVITLEKDKVCISPLTIDSGGTVIFNIVSRSITPSNVTALLNGCGKFRRLS